MGSLSATACLWAAALVLATCCLVQAAGFRARSSRLATASTGSTSDVSDGLKLLSVIFRHGDRAPLSTYPLDPYIDYEYLPEGKGNLNIQGKKRAYDLGTFLRQRYCSFLGPELLPDTAVLRSTYMPRALETGALVMASMYKPAPDQRWGDCELCKIWSPVAFTTMPALEDTLLDTEIENDCPAYAVDVLLGQYELQSAMDKLTNNGEVTKYIAVNTGLDPSDTAALAQVCDTLISQESCGLTLPNWTAPVYPEPLKSMLGVEFQTQVYTQRQRRLYAGVLLNELRNNAVAYQNNSLPERRRIYVYSAHDTVLAPVLATLGVWDGRQPPFSSAIMFELREQNSQLGFKILYRNSSADPMELSLPGCGVFCPLDTFQELYQDDFLTSDQQKAACISGD